MLLFSAASEPMEMLVATVQQKVYQCVEAVSLSLVSVQMLPFSAASEPGEMLVKPSQCKVSQCVAVIF